MFVVSNTDLSQYYNVALIKDNNATESAVFSLPSTAPVDLILSNASTGLVAQHARQNAYKDPVAASIHRNISLVSQSNFKVTSSNLADENQLVEIDINWCIITKYKNACRKLNLSVIFALC